MLSVSMDIVVLTERADIAQDVDRVSTETVRVSTECRQSVDTMLTLCQMEMMIILEQSHLSLPMLVKAAASLHSAFFIYFTGAMTK